MASFIINPGSGPVVQANECYSWKNIKQFVFDLGERGIEVTSISRRSEKDYGEGRFAFELSIGYQKVGKSRKIEIQMPGTPIEDVRYLGRNEQSIWRFWRLYVDGSSFVWEFALNVCKYSLES